MTIFCQNIEDLTLENNFYRKVVNTTAFSQLVLMCIKPNQNINNEIHDINDQFFKIKQGTAKIIVNGTEYILEPDFACVVPAGAEHEVINIGSNELKLYTIYSPPHHPLNTIHKTKQDAVEYEKSNNLDVI